MVSRTIVLGAVLTLFAVGLAGCADNNEESVANDPDVNVNEQNRDCEERNLVDDDVVSDEDGSTLGQCEQYENEQG